MKKYTTLAIVTVCVSVISGSTAVLFAPNTKPPEAPYYLKDCQGKLALYGNDSKEQLKQYDIYTYLLPPSDVNALRQGLPVNSPAELNALLEDYGL